MAGFNKTWLFDVIGQRLAQFLNAGGECVVGYDGPVPKRCEQFLLGNRLSRVRDQDFQYGGSLGSEPHLTLTRPQSRGFEFKPVATKAYVLLHRALSVLPGAISEKSRSTPGTFNLHYPYAWDTTTNRQHQD